jgi:hypothetical protein
MFLAGFTDELLGCRDPLVKVAKAKLDTKLIGRMGAVGALAGLLAHAGSHLKSQATGDPYAAPQGTALGAAARLGTAGAAGGGLLQLLGRLGTRR